MVVKYEMTSEKQEQKVVPEYVITSTQKLTCTTNYTAD